MSPPDASRGWPELRWPAAGGRVGTGLTEGDSVPPARQRGPQGTGQAAGHTRPHCHLASRPGMCSSPPAALPAERGGPSPAVSPPARLGFQLSPPPPSPKVTSCSPPALGSIHAAGTGPRDGAACLPASVSKQMEDISSLPHPSPIICLARFLPGTPLLTASKSPVLACLFPGPGLITCLAWASIFPKAISP